METYEAYNYNEFETAVKSNNSENVKMVVENIVTANGEKVEDVFNLLSSMYWGETGVILNFEDYGF